MVIMDSCGLVISDGIFDLPSQMSEHYWTPQSNVSNETSTGKTFQRTISAQVRLLFWFGMAQNPIDRIFGVSHKPVSETRGVRFKMRRQKKRISMKREHVVGQLAN